jgi:hypothetical protein
MIERLRMMPLPKALWWFIENNTDNLKNSTEIFFMLRERYRNEEQHVLSAPQPPEFDNSQAIDEGWSIFKCYGSDNGPYQLQCCDDDDVFTKDEQAWRFVVDQARMGSEYHKKALQYLRDYNLMELHSIARVCGGVV